MTSTLRSRIRRSTLSADALVRQYYGRLLRHSRWRGTGPAVDETPLEFAERFSGRLDGAASVAARRLTGLYVRLEYGAHTITDAERTEATAAWRAVRRGLWRWNHADKTTLHRTVTPSAAAPPPPVSRRRRPRRTA
ncbi:MAG: DUF4129 domain-containing protein [Chloroflexota bacterium]